MRYNGKEIGGKELGPVSFSFQGDEELARLLVGQGRAVLGQLKQNMQFNKNTYGIERKILKGGVTIEAHSIKGPLADQDKVSIYVPKRGAGGKRYKCLGYIIQGFGNVSGTSLASNTVIYHVTTPTGKTLGYNSDYGYGFSPSDPYQQNGFPDNGAKYLPNGAYYDYDPAIEDSRVFYIDPEYQRVYTKQGSQQVWWTGSPYEYVWDIEWYNSPIGFPGLNPGWSYVNAYAYDSGECAPGAPWEEETLRPCTYSITYAIYADANLNSYYQTGIAGYSGIQYYTVHYSGPFTGSGPGCSRVYPDPYLHDMTLPNGYDADIGHYNSLTIGKPIELQVWNAASLANFEYAMGNIFTHQYNSQTYSWMQYVDSGTRSIELMRRTDGHGFYVTSGFYLDSGYVLTERNAQYGHGSLFMLPQGETRNYRFEDSILTDNDIDGAETTTDVYIAAVHLKPATLNFTSEVGDCGARWGGFFPENFVPTPSNGETYNGLRHSKYIIDIASNFGLPCACEDGVHEIRVRRGNTTQITFDHLDIWLLATDALYGEYGFFKVKIDDMVTTAGKTEWEKLLKIDVRGFDNAEEVYGLVSTEPITDQV